MWAFRKAIKSEKPDVVVNYYEPLFGLYNWLFSPAVKVIAIGHQFMFLHPGYKPVQFGKPPGFVFLKAFTRLAGAGAEKLALSFYDAEPDKGVTVVPPLLRSQLLELKTAPKPSGLVITYLINPGYLEEFISESNEGVPSRVYTKVSVPEKRGSVEIVPISGEAFIRDMSCARAVCCTAGFETVAEAMYLGVPLLMRPIDGHEEQRMNAQDAYMTIPSCWPVTTFKAWSRKISAWQTLDTGRQVTEFRKWVNSSESVFARLLKLN
jgi:uncharacterized protein (TIGR00661 family)